VKIFALSTNRCDWDQYYGFVVAAKDLPRARYLVLLEEVYDLPSLNPDVGWEVDVFPYDGKLSVGTICDNTDLVGEGVILSDFKAG
jgi:hypothetical protein